MKLYTVQRTVVYTVDVDAESETDALEFVNGMGGAAFDFEELVQDEVIAVSDMETV